MIKLNYLNSNHVDSGDSDEKGDVFQIVEVSPADTLDIRVRPDFGARNVFGVFRIGEHLIVRK